MHKRPWIELGMNKLKQQPDTYRIVNKGLKGYCLPLDIHSCQKRIARNSWQQICIFWKQVLQDLQHQQN